MCQPDTIAAEIRALTAKIHAVSATISNRQSAVNQSAICNPQSAIRNLQSAICNLQSAICNQEPPPGLFPHVGGGGSVVMRLIGFAFSIFIASSTARSS